jgi:prepilin-type N-terminal cleavage/methylation domain-containing protein
MQEAVFAERPSAMVVQEGRASCGENKLKPCRSLGLEAGFTLIELLVALSILLVVLGGIMTPLVSATKAEADLQTRFRAQESARLALTTFQRDVHCATAVSPTSGSTATVTLTLSAGCESGSTSVTWCTATNGSTYDLWRVPAGTCTTSTAGSRRLSQSLTSQSVFTPDGTVHVGSPVTLSVQLSLGVKTGTSTYVLTTSVYSRTGARQ